LLNDLTPSQRDLAEYMSGISERAYFASWIEGLEYALWRAIEHHPCKYGSVEIDAIQADQLAKLSELCGGWMIFNDEDGELFIPLAQWKALYEQRERSAES